MLNTKKVLYSLKDVAIMPAAISEIRHRNECDTTYDDGMLPIFTAPMPCVVNLATYKTYKENKINPILPRTEDVELRKSMCHGTWCAFSLSEFKEIFLNNDVDGGVLKVLIDIANGNMLELYNVSKEAKEKYGNRLKLMVGNIANPETFRKFGEIGVDYIRLSVGSGNACFVPGTKIKTKNGYKNIEDIVINDEVLTHNGIFRKVINTFKKDNIKKLLKINDVITTPEHKFYVINKVDKNKINEDNLKQFAYWCNAEELNKDKHFLIKCSA